MIGGAMGGAVGNVGARFVGDVYDQLLSGKEGFDSFGDYAVDFATGGVMGAALAPVGFYGAKYLPASARNMVQTYAVHHPEMISLLEASRAAGAGAAFRVRMTVREWRNMGGGGGFGGFGGMQPAFATVGVAFAKIASLPPDAEVWVTARPVIDSNAPMQRLGDEADPLFEVESVEAVDPVERYFDDYGDEASYADDGHVGDFGYDNGVRDLLGQSPEVAAVRTVGPEIAGLDGIYSRPKFRPGVREAVYEKARADSPDGIVRDPDTRAEIPFDSDWQMGHEPGWEFRKHRSSAARRHLTREQFVDEYNDPNHYRPETPATNKGHELEALDHVDHWLDGEEF
jgi:hypothetical protein